MALVSLIGARHDPTRLVSLPLNSPLPHLQPSIVHLGIGAFARAHILWATEAALRQQPEATDWGVIGVSLRSPDTRDALQPQDGLYLVNLRGMDGNGRSHETLDLISCLVALLVAPEDPEAVLRALESESTRIITLTITEKGYCLGSGGALDLEDPDIAHDLLNPDSPRSAIGYLVQGLERRYRSHGLGVTLLSCDNLPANGQQLRRAVLTLGARRSPGLVAWIEQTCRFPCTMVDRIVPRTTEADREALALRFGVQDAWPVMGEPFFEWVIEDEFARGRPAWELAGVRLVDDAQAWEVLKLRMVNGAHSAIAYLSQCIGWATVDVAVQQPLMRAYLKQLWQHDIEPTLPELPGLILDNYRERLLQRFANPALQHQTRQIAMDGTQKIPVRWLPVLLEHPKRPSPRLALAMAAWLVHVLRSFNEEGPPLQDPQAHRLMAIWKSVCSGLPGSHDADAVLREFHHRVALKERLLGDQYPTDPAWLHAVDEASSLLLRHDWQTALTQALDPA